MVRSRRNKPVDPMIDHDAPRQIRTIHPNPPDHQDYLINKARFQIEMQRRRGPDLQIDRGEDIIKRQLEKHRQKTSRKKDK